MMLKQPQRNNSQFGHEATVVTAEPQRPTLTLTTASFTLSVLFNITVFNTWIHDKGKEKKSTVDISHRNFHCIR